MVMEKVVIFAFVGELPCFAHALLNGLDMKKRGWDVKLVVEGAATRLLKEPGGSGKAVCLFVSTGASRRVDRLCLSGLCQYDGDPGHRRSAGAAAL